MSTCECVAGVQDERDRLLSPVPQPWQTEFRHTISRAVVSTHHCFPIPETHKVNERVGGIHTHTLHTHCQLLMVRKRTNQILILQCPPGIEKKKKRRVDLPFCYWFHENEFHRLSLRCLHSQTLWNQILRREKQRGTGRREGENREEGQVSRGTLNKTSASKRKRTTRRSIITSQTQKLFEYICGEIGFGSHENKRTRQTLSSLNQGYDEICHIIKGTQGPPLQREDGKTAQSSFNEIQGAKAQHLNFIKCILCSFYWNLTV